MRTTFRYIALAAAIISVIGCRDQKDPLAPEAPSKMIIVQQPPILQLPRPGDLMEIVAGDLHTCIRKRSGAVSCWGWNEYGQIGVTATTQCGTFGGDGPCWKQPALVTAPANANFTSAIHITAGSFHTCALEPSGAAWCWGYNYYGQIGKGTGGDQANPLMVAGGVSFSSLAAGDETTCGTTAANQLLCWGEFPLAPGPTFRTYSPAVVASGVGFTALAVANDHGCGNIGSNNWFCWGSNKSGQLATDTNALQTSTPFTWVHALDGETNVSITSGTTCGDQSSGALCFGHNRIIANNLSQFGLLGSPSFSAPATFVPQTPGPLHGVALSSNHACGLDASNAAWCWGVNDIGQLGNASNQSSTAIVPVSGGHTYRALAVGRNHTCGIGTDNHVYCWGDNYYGQLGQPAASMYGVNSPVQAIDP